MIKPQFRPHIALRAMMAAPGGITASQALERATTGLASLRDQGLAAIDQHIEHLGALDAVTQSEAMYAVSNQLFADAGFWELADVSHVALGLCRLLSAEEAATGAAIQVHIDSLRALRRPEVNDSAALRGAVLAGLQKVLEQAAKRRGP